MRPRIPHFRKYNTRRRHRVIFHGVSHIRSQGARMCRFFSVFILTLALATTLHAQQQQPEPSYDQSQVPLEQDILPGAPKIVLIAGSKSHGPMEHEFFAGTALLQKMLKQNGVNAVMARDGWPKDWKVFDGAAAVMIYADGGGGHPMLRKDGDKSKTFQSF